MRPWRRGTTRRRHHTPRGVRYATVRSAAPACRCSWWASAAGQWQAIGTGRSRTIRAMALDHAMFRPRHAEASVLHAVIRQHLDECLRAAADRADGAGLPEFIAVASALRGSGGAVSESGRLRQGTGGPPGRRPPRAPRADV